MAYSTSTPPRLLVAGTGGAPSLWTYESADALADINTAGYITNADDLGMRAGDYILTTDTDTYAGGIAIVNSVTAGGAADTSDGTAIDGTDTD